jgi:hypothetical protein
VRRPRSFEGSSRRRGCAASVPGKSPVTMRSDEKASSKKGVAEFERPISVDYLLYIDVLLRAKSNPT